METPVGTNPQHSAAPAAAEADLTPFLRHLASGKCLSQQQTFDAFSQLMGGRCSEAQVAGLLALLASRMPVVDELVGAVRALRSFALLLECSVGPAQILDTAGTGGAPKAFNSSTLAAIVAASLGVHVAKSGNRSRTGRGSAEVMEALGFPLELPVAVQRRCLEEAHFAFCHAPTHHPAARHAAPVRKALGFPTLFNLIGPLSNPALARRSSVGVYDRAFVPVVAEALGELGSEHALVFHGLDGLDEMTTGAATLVAEVTRSARGYSVHVQEVTPESVGVKRGDPLSIAPSSLPHAVQLFQDVLAGRGSTIATEMTALNSAAALVAGGRCESLAEGVRAARGALASGAAAATLARVIQIARGASIPPHS